MAAFDGGPFATSNFPCILLVAQAVQLQSIYLLLFRTISHHFAPFRIIRELLATFRTIRQHCGKSLGQAFVRFLLISHQKWGLVICPGPNFPVASARIDPNGVPLWALGRIRILTEWICRILVSDDYTRKVAGRDDSVLVPAAQNHSVATSVECETVL